MMQQYWEIKETCPTAILFYRLGDFYEMFFDDAKLASRVLELTLTGRDCGEEERAPMCGVPYHSAEGYIAKLVERGYKVAICEQVEDPKEAKGIVKREIIRMITPGTLTESEMLDEKMNNYIASVFINEEGAGVCFADISTGYFSATSSRGQEKSEKFVIDQLGAYRPKEVILNFPEHQYPKLDDFFAKRINCMANYWQFEYFSYPDSLERCKTQFKGVDFLSDVGTLEVSAAGALLEYISQTQKTDISYINEIKLYTDEEFLQMDISSRRSLELCEVMKGGKKGSLLWAIDETKTSGGARLLRKWLESPLCSVSEIMKRQNAVGAFYGDFDAREELAEILKSVLDLERLAAKVVYSTATAKDLRAIRQTALTIPKIGAVIKGLHSERLSEIYSELDTLEDLAELIDRAIVDEPPFSVREGGIIKDGYNEDIDKLRSIMKDGKYWISKIEETEREKTGIKTLRVAYNRVFGYYIEVTKSNLEDVPDRYIRKQTLANCERFITNELKEFEASVLGASDKVVKLEYDIFCCIRNTVYDNVIRLKDVASKISELDVYLSLALCAVKNRYTPPEVDLSDMIVIKDGRHPVVEQFSQGNFVPNDTLLDTNKNRLMLITGPNMAGKSTYMRQNALIVILAQIGSYVPAASARIGICDKIFTRVGASDDLASGTSTFMLEMNEVAYILENATKRSLIVYDEIGRGTSTFDGMSIARATAEYTASKKIGAKTLFATHYHELTELENTVEGVVNYNIAAKKKGDELIFLRRIVKGAADDSYGIEVAKLAGVPSPVIKRAKEILASLESDDARKEKRQIKEAESIEDLNISLESVANDEIREKLTNIDLNIITPVDAFDILRKLKSLL